MRRPQIKKLGKSCAAGEHEGTQKAVFVKLVKLFFLGYLSIRLNRCDRCRKYSLIIYWPKTGRRQKAMLDEEWRQGKPPKKPPKN